MIQIGLYIIVATLCLLLAWGFLWGLGQLVLRNEERNQDTEARLYTKQAARTTERLNALCEARDTGDYSKYNAIRAAHGAEYDADVRALVDQETVIDERTQYELDHGINPYKVEKRTPVPSGKLARR